MADVAPEPSDKEVLKNSPFSKGEWPFETFIDVGFDGVYQFFDTPANAGLQSVTSKHLLALAYASGQSDGLLAIDPESFLQRWESMIDARALMPSETGTAASGDKRLQHGDGVGHHGGGAPRYQGAQGNERSVQSGWKGEKLAGDSRR